jgi:hypothetical protein
MPQKFTTGVIVLGKNIKDPKLPSHSFPRPQLGKITEMMDLNNV